jgi:[1-hydroxy-2-(trimethylamino)ethyl]phosphonate dioxygenase
MTPTNCPGGMARLASATARFAPNILVSPRISSICPCRLRELRLMPSYRAFVMVLRRADDAPVTVGPINRAIGPVDFRDRKRLGCGRNRKWRAIMPAAEILHLFESAAARAYGLSGVSQLEHALQAAASAEKAGASKALVVAALLHDIGHLIHDIGESPAEQGVDDRHESLGSAYLSRLFPPAVSEPVRLHVPAKRYLVATEVMYNARLSADSVRSLALQGGPMSADEQEAFRREAFWRDAVALRRFDEDAKVRGAVTPSLQDYLPLIESCLRDRAAAA